MPRQILFAVAENIIVSAEDHAASLINLITGLTIQVAGPLPEPLPEPITIPVKMTVCVVWLREPEDEDKLFEQRVEIVLPEGQALGESLVRFGIPDRSHVNTVKFLSFPVSTPGVYQVRLSLRETNGGDNWRFIADYPMQIDFVGIPNG
jgi:hypothetical protein